jgi:hypothetical protein
MKHPYTFGVTGNEEFPQYDQVLTDKSENGNSQTLDYIFEVFLDKNDEQERENKVKNILIIIFRKN